MKKAFFSTGKFQNFPDSCSMTHWGWVEWAGTGDFGPNTQSVLVSLGDRTPEMQHRNGERVENVSERQPSAS